MRRRKNEGGGERQEIGEVGKRERVGKRSLGGGVMRKKEAKERRSDAEVKKGGEKEKGKGRQEKGKDKEKKEERGERGGNGKKEI